MASASKKDLSMKIGITGHQHLHGPAIWPWVESKINEIIGGVTDLVGVTSLAIGADTVFADLIVKAGGKLLVVIPFPKYALEFKDLEDRRKYSQLLQTAYKVEVLEATHTKENSYYNAGKYLVDISERVIAVWDGKPAVGLGGTGDIVHYAEQTGTPIYHINPETNAVSYISNHTSSTRPPNIACN